VVAFHRSKELWAQSILLVYPRENCKLSIVADASDRAVGAELQQEMVGVSQPIAFFVRKLDMTQKHYSAFDCELFAAYAAICHFPSFVDRRKFIWFSDLKQFIHAFYSRGELINPRRSR